MAVLHCILFFFIRMANIASISNCNILITTVWNTCIWELLYTLIFGERKISSVHVQCTCIDLKDLLHLIIDKQTLDNYQYPAEIPLNFHQTRPGFSCLYLHEKQSQWSQQHIQSEMKWIFVKSHLVIMFQYWYTKCNRFTEVVAV